MITKDLLKACRTILKSKEAEKPDGGFITPKGKVTYSDLIQELDKLIKWVYPKLETDRLKKVVRCKECSNYKKFLDKKNSTEWHKSFVMLCKVDMKPKHPEFYCKNGEIHELE